ncbi:SMP-30/gluconolactonase/LRE family protein [Cognatishimia sp. WU-CL00825]|uniref:SMP-30/gluconolactonase/LRE family protein n=1 Tax=Cognatishimia sp. WU-CL00825 TaxID=3127658 RepID=UPI0031080589
MTSAVFDERVCELGEGPLWHPTRQQLFWFDILGRRLLTRKGDEAQEWVFDEYVSAAGWVDDNTLMMASESGLYRLNLINGARKKLADIEADNPVTRSNDGRADPQGGFWIGTMGIDGEPQAGAIYRYYKGEVRKLFGDITVSNSICFAPSGDLAYFCDTRANKIMKVALDSLGWPVGTPDVFIDVSAEGLNADGSVVDAEGNLWNAQWGVNRVACYAPDGTFLRAVSFAGEQTSCPAFGGADLRSLFVTTAAVGLDGPNEGKTYVCEMSDVKGQAEHQVIL